MSSIIDTAQQTLRVLHDDSFLPRQQVAQPVELFERLPVAELPKLSWLKAESYSVDDNQIADSEQGQGRNTDRIRRSFGRAA